MIAVVLFGGAFVCIALFYFININNSLVSLKNQVQKAWANIDVILKQRFDEIPQLIEIINQFLVHEKNILNQVIQARTLYGHAKTEGDKIKASQELTGAFRGIVAIGENYPELKSNHNFTQLQGRISELEESLAHRREHYNDAVTNYNTMIEQFPSSIIAGMSNHQTKVFFEVADFEKVKPSLKINV
ncbi:MAG: LemA family protein [Bdellovibrionales bacterium]|nr:LemA family protein [Bdellovibrionales bacterium]